jgi:hypothetical protein
MQGIFHIILSVPENIVLDLNNVMQEYWRGIVGVVLFIVRWSSGHISALKTWVVLQVNHDPEAFLGVQFIRLN